MLYGRESIAHYSPTYIAVWMLMAFQGGLLNMGGFMACHKFVSHVTGFATFFGYELTQTNGQEPLGMLAVPLFFLFGCMISGFLVDTRLRTQKRPLYTVAFGLMFALMSLITVLGYTGYFGGFGEPFLFFRDYVLLALLCLVCGIQNGTITAASKSVVRTTHLTGITTDLGLGLVRFLNRKKITDGSDEFLPNAVRMGIIAFFIIGSVAGGYIFHQLQFMGFVIPTITSGFLLTIMAYFRLHKFKNQN